MNRTRLGKVEGFALVLGLAALAAVPASAQTSRPISPTGPQTSGSTSGTPKYSLGVLGEFSPNGMLIGRVVPGYAAEKAGLVPGDLIYKMDNKIVRNQQEFNRVMNSCGGSISLVVRRAATGQLERVTVQLTGGGRGIPAPYQLGTLGRYTPQGALLARVGEGTSAAAVGLAPGDLIARINGMPVTTQEAFYKAMYASGGRVDLAVVKGATGEAGTLRTRVRVFELGIFFDSTAQGMLILLVAPLTPAARAGLRQGDVIASIDGQFIRTQGDFMTVLSASGGTVNLVVRRGGVAGQVAKLRVNVMNNPLGCWCEEADDGMRVTTHVKGMYADRAGLKRGDIILRVDGRAVSAQDDFLEALERVRGTARLEVRKADTERVVRVDIDVSR
jgi:S1-C subfamily serine protease